MKKFYLLLSAVMVAIGTNAIALASPMLASSMDVTSLTNKDVVTMVEQNLGADSIIKAIKSSPCTFDTFPSVMKELKRRGVPEDVLQAMIDAPYGPAAEVVTEENVEEEGPIYHFTESIKQYLAPANTGRRYTPTSSRARTARRPNILR